MYIIVESDEGGDSRTFKSANLFQAHNFYPPQSNAYSTTRAFVYIVLYRLFPDVQFFYLITCGVINKPFHCVHVKDKKDLREKTFSYVYMENREIPPVGVSNCLGFYFISKPFGYNFPILHTHMIIH